MMQGRADGDERRGRRFDWMEGARALLLASGGEGTVSRARMSAVSGARAARYEGVKVAGGLRAALPGRVDVEEKLKARGRI